MDKIKTSKTYIKTITSTRKSEKEIDKPIYRPLEDKTLEKVNISDLSKGSFSYGGAFPFIMEALNQLCTLNPETDTGRKIIQRQDDKTELYYKVFLKWETLLELATGKEKLVKDNFRHEVMSLFKAPPTLYINLENGYSMLTHPIIINNIVYEDKEKMTPKEAEICSRLGITKKISYLEIEFLKPLFSACLEKDTKKGYIYLDKAFYTKELLTINKIQNDPRLLVQFSKFYNPKTKQYVSKTSLVYYKFILYFLTHITSNENADFTNFDAVEMLKHVDPGQLDRFNNIRNKYDTKLFIEKACTLYNIMAQQGYCESTAGVPTYCLYDTSNVYKLYFKRDKPRTNIQNFTSNFEEIQQNEPLQLEFNKDKKEYKI